jgi:selenocysteine lyase/cysteine desulfurase
MCESYWESRANASTACSPVSGLRVSARLRSTHRSAARVSSSTAPFEGLARFNGVHLYGPGDMKDRLPTFAFTVDGHSPATVIKQLTRHRIFA